MADEADSTGGLPRWPAAAREEPTTASEDRAGGEGWLVLIGLLYPLVGFGVLLGGGGAWGPVAFNPLIIPFSVALLIATVIGFRWEGVRFRWLSIAAFCGWVLLMAYGQWLIYGAAIAGV